MIAFIQSVGSDVTAEFVLFAVLLLADKAQPIARRFLSALWGHIKPKLAEKYGAAKSAHPWRKAFAALALPAFVGSAVTAMLMRGMEGTAPPWAVCSLASVIAGILLVGALDSFPTRKLLP